MTNDEINIAVAEGCGWINCRYDYDPAYDDKNHRDCFKMHIGIPPFSQKYGDVPHAYFRIPDYTACLNAMHEVERTIQDKLGYVEYVERLYWMVTADNDDVGLDAKTIWPLIYATARQRAEAFLRSINKWDTAEEYEWFCPVCNHKMTDAQSKNYRSCPTGVHIVRHLRLAAWPTVAKGQTALP